MREWVHIFCSLGYIMDYNLDNYSIRDLEEMFNLCPPYDPKAVFVVEKTLKDKLFQECGYSTKYTDMSDFITQAIQKILYTPQHVASNVGPNDLIEQQVTPTLHAKSKPYVKGSINPLSINTIDRTLTINSKFRTNPHKKTPSTDYYIELPYPVKQVLSMKLDSVSLPLAFYVVHESNNSFKVDSTTVTVPIGNYTGAALVAALNAALPPGTTAAITPATAHVVLSSGAVFKLDFSTGLGWIMGYREAVYDGLASYVAEALPSLSWDYVYIVVNDYTGNTANENIGLLAESYLDSNILSKLILDNSVLVQNYATNATRNYFGPVDVQKLGIQLLDESGRVVNLRESDWSFTLVLTCLYQEL